MLTKLTIRGFKRFDKATVELGNPVVFIGPNNSGKTSAMQALALWDIGLRRWKEKRGKQGAPEKRPGVIINRRDLLAIPIPYAALLWRETHTRNVRKVEGAQQTSNIRIEITVEGITSGTAWRCGLEFDYANEEAFYCRPLRTSKGKSPDRMPIPSDIGDIKIAFLPPMSGLAATETRLDEGAINVRIGEGRTAEVLRNLCYRILEEKPEQWELLTKRISSLFGADLDFPRYVTERGEITMGYREGKTRLDLSASGRGLQQTLLILAYMCANPGAVILLDEPDAHLEILRQRQIYSLLTEMASQHGSQIIAASHSEVLLNEAADRDLVIAFIGKPHRMGEKSSEVLKALKEIGYEQYYQAEQSGWVLYLEGSTDLAILQAFAARLNHVGAQRALERPFVHYVCNQPPAAKKHYFGLREALPELRGVALYDRLPSKVPKSDGLRHLVWKKREIENYLCTRTTLMAYTQESTQEDQAMPLFAVGEADKRMQIMDQTIKEIEMAMRTLGQGDPWGKDVKASDDFLKPLFERYFKKLGLPNLMAKKNFHELARHVPDEEIVPEIKKKLDAIAEVARGAKRRRGP